MKVAMEIVDEGWERKDSKGMCLIKEVGEELSNMSICWVY